MVFSIAAPYCCTRMATFSTAIQPGFSTITAFHQLAPE
jgi:hypothetical protein